MKLGAQFYSIRTQTQTKEGLEQSFARIREIGYDNVQLSGIGPIAAPDIRDISEKYQLPVVCTHSPYQRIVEDTEALIAEHKLYGAKTIGLGAMGSEFRGSYEGVKAFCEAIKEPIKRIEDAGLFFAYHNHSFEFNAPDGGDYFDVLIEKLPTMHFILDTFWLVYANRDPMKYIRTLGASRIQNVHFKDMLEYHTMLEKSGPAAQDLICACGNGIIDFKPIVTLCDELGIPNALVEQDNAPSFDDPFVQMRISHDSLRPLF